MILLLFCLSVSWNRFYFFYFIVFSCLKLYFNGFFCYRSLNHRFSYVCVCTKWSFVSLSPCCLVKGYQLSGQRSKTLIVRVSINAGCWMKRPELTLTRYFCICMQACIHSEMCLKYVFEILSKQSLFVCPYNLMFELSWVIDYWLNYIWVWHSRFWNMGSAMSFTSCCWNWHLQK